MHLHHTQLMNSVKVYIKYVLLMVMGVYLIMVVNLQLLNNIVIKMVKTMSVYGEIIIALENNVNMLEIIILDMNNVNSLCFNVLEIMIKVDVLRRVVRMLQYNSVQIKNVNLIYQIINVLLKKEEDVERM